MQKIKFVLYLNFFSKIICFNAICSKNVLSTQEKISWQKLYLKYFHSRKPQDQRSKSFCWRLAILYITPWTPDPNMQLPMEHSREGNGTPLQYCCPGYPMDGGAWWAAVHGVAKSWTRLSDFTFTFHFPALEKEMETHSSVLAWRIPGTGEPGGLPSMGSHRVRHDQSELAAAYRLIATIFLNSIYMR